MCTITCNLLYLCTQIAQEEILIYDFKKVLNGFCFFLVGVLQTNRSALQVCFVFKRD